MPMFRCTAAVRIILRDEGKSGSEGGLPLGNISSSINKTMTYMSVLSLLIYDQTQTATSSETENIQ